ncbi:hypothetical protein [Streptomyces xanthii]|uniref:Uncharacterized protein n=1 Tax=Streptomyces xanthii TaxID=2768069 RepID=A0A7H1B9J3_9ACTN|nr:hypothetical protein [Streptomyces xanthii]QNS05398.1 hypothetical protein IAG42_18550 [Streptomyces xanthii]
MDTDPTPTSTAARRRLEEALHTLAVTFRGMTAIPEEANCTCHWGSEEEQALLKVPDVELDPDLLRRTWLAIDWTDHGAVMRRILPQFARELAAGRAEACVYGVAEAGGSLARGHWQQWPERQAAAVRDFLDAWWTHTLTDPTPPVPAHDVLAVCAEASGTLTPYLATWTRTTGPVSDDHLTRAATEWEYDLLGDDLPWKGNWYDTDRDRLRTDLTDWLLGPGTDRLRGARAPEELMSRIALLALTDEARYTHPDWPGHRY